MRIVLILASFVTISLHAAIASANVLQQIPIERQFAQADLVMIGRIGARQHCLVEDVQRACAEIISDVVLKGGAVRGNARRLLVLEAEYSEFGIETMALSGTLIIFMRRYREEIYLPIVGGNSVFSIERAR